MSAYRLFVEREKATHSIVRLCRVLGVSPSGCLGLAHTHPVVPSAGG